MPEQDAVDSEPRRRVRTGCLTCRRRRRKCDELKPTCSNCKSKSLQCRWGYNVAFVNSVTGKRSRLVEQDEASEEASENVITHTFINQAATTTDANASISPPNPNHVSWAVEGASKASPAPDARIIAASDSCSHSPLEHDAEQQICLSVQPDDSVWDLNMSNRGRQEYEMGLFVHYRYKIAPSMDLGMGALNYSVRASLRASQVPALRSALLGLAAGHRWKTGSENALDGTLGPGYIAETEYGEAQASLTDYVTILMLRTLQQILNTDTSLWPQILQTACAEATRLSTIMSAEQWQLLARLVLSASLLNPASTSLMTLPACSGHGSAQPVLVSQSNSALEQLQGALHSLHRSLLFLHVQLAREQHSRFPILSTWQACWSESQAWFSLRTEDMQPTLEMPATEPRFPSTEHLFSPVIIFSNSCALLASICHHITAIVLLQKRPRLIQPLAESESSTSIIWHALRIIGIVANACDDAIWDSFVVATLVVVGRIVSHDSQRAVVADLLQNAAKATGLQLEPHIRALRTSIEVPHPA